MHSLEFAIEPEDRLDRLITHRSSHGKLRQPERRVEGSALDAFERYFESSTTGWRLSIQQLVDRHVEGSSEALQLPELEFALTVFHHGHLGWRTPDRRPEVIEGHPS